MSKVGDEQELGGERWVLAETKWRGSSHTWWENVTNPNLTLSRMEFDRRRTAERYPESEKLAQKRGERLTLGEFFQWLQGEKGYTLGEHVYDYPDDRFDPVTTNLDTLIMEFLGVDRKKLEAERQEMLEKMREGESL